MSGRPRKSGKRHPNGQLVREPSNDKGSPEFLKHRENLVGPEYVNDPRASNPLGLFEIAEIITASQSKAGWDWATAWWTVYGKPHGGGVDMEAGDRAHYDGPNPAMQRRADTGRDALRKAGTLAEIITHKVCIEQQIPAWYSRDRKRMKENGWCIALRDGVRALEDAL